MVGLFNSLTRAVEGNPYIAFGAAFIWGILSILLSPCHLASIPLVVGYVDAQGNIPIKRAFLISLLFSTGILITIGIVGTATALAGRVIGDLGGIGNYVVAVIFFIIGLYLLGIITLPWLGPDGKPIKQKGLIGAFIIGLMFGLALGPCTFAYMAPMLGVVGLMFGLALGPCTFAYMAPMLGVVFKVAALKLLFAIGLLLAYGMGHCSIIVLAGSLTETVGHYLNWTEKSKGAVIVKRVCGVLVILGGVYLLISA
jgi:cytochrome c-type biogenesis protein